MIPRLRTRDTARTTLLVGIALALTAGIALSLTVGTGLAAAAGPADAPDRTARIGTSDHTAVDGGTAVAVTLEDASTGVQRYNLTLHLDGPDGAQIGSAEAGDVEGFEVRSQRDESITFRAADLGQAVEAGATDVTLGTVTVADAGDAEPDVSVTTHDFRDDESEQIEPALTTEPVDVEGAAIPAEDGGSGDGLAEALPGTPLAWAVGVAGLAIVLVAVAALRW